MYERNGGAHDAAAACHLSIVNENCDYLKPTVQSHEMCIVYPFSPSNAEISEWTTRSRYAMASRAEDSTSESLINPLASLVVLPLSHSLPFLSFSYSLATILSVMPVPTNTLAPWATMPIPQNTNTKMNHGNPAPENHQTSTSNRFTAT